MSSFATAIRFNAGKAALLTISFVWCVADAQPSASGESDSNRAGPTEEVIVVGQRTLKQLRAAVEDAEDVAYEMFNELNDDDDYDIVCHREEPTGSRISYRNCRAKFVDRLLAENTAESFSLGAALPLPLIQIEMRMEVLTEKVEALARENPDFLEATKEVQLRKDAFEAARQNAAPD